MALCPIIGIADLGRFASKLSVFRFWQIFNDSHISTDFDRFLQISEGQISTDMDRFVYKLSVFCGGEKFFRVKLRR